MAGPISVEEAAALLSRTLSVAISRRAVPQGADATGMVFFTPATGQSFRIEITEVTAPLPEPAP